MEMKGITCCAECAYYSMKKHKCTRCNNVESDARKHFYDDCPLPDVKPSANGQWISVKDRMPKTIPCNAGTEYSEAVIVITKDRIAVTAVWNGKEWIGDFDYWEADENTVTHWIPLPKLPTPSCTIS